MQKDDAYRIISDILKQKYGEFLELGEIGIIRKATGARWAGKVNVNIDGNKVTVGMIELTVNGMLSEIFSDEDVVKVIRNYSSSSGEPDPFADIFSDMSEDEEDKYSEMSVAELRKKLDHLLKKGDAESLKEAREIYPVLLTINDSKGDILHEMGLLELAFDNPNIALEYMENAVLEYANFAELSKMKKVENSVKNLLGEDALKKTNISITIENTQKHLKPIKSITDVPLFSGLPNGIIMELGIIAEDIVLKPGEVIIKEGEPAQFAIILRSNVLEVVLESFADKPKTIRCCYPGEFLGESSIIAKPGSLSCTATLKAGEKGAKLWKFNGEDLIDVMEKFPEIANRIFNAKNIHLLDSFFSMHPSMKDLTPDVRDRFLSCLKNIDTYDEETLIIKGESVPESAFLIMSGFVTIRTSDGREEIINPDHFIAMSDVLHGVESDRKFYASANAVLAEFDGEKLRKMAVESSAGVVAILERLN